MSDLGMKLSRVLFECEPKLLVCDMEASARAAFEVSNLLGCIMATAMAKQTPEQYHESLKAVLQRVHDSAMNTVANAQFIDPNTTRQ